MRHRWLGRDQSELLSLDPIKGMPSRQVPPRVISSVFIQLNISNNVQEWKHVSLLKGMLFLTQLCENFIKQY